MAAVAAAKVVVGLRRYLVCDVDAHFAAARKSIDAAHPWLPWCRPDYSVFESAQWVLSRDAAWQSGSECSFVIQHLATGTFLGSIGLGLAGQPLGSANLGYWVRSGWQRRGVAAAAIGQAARFAFAALGLQRIEIIAAVDNLPSQRAATRAGAQVEGVLRRRMLLHGRMHDAVVLSLVPSDLAEQGLTGP